jgi:hypothetical protein
MHHYAILKQLILIGYESFSLGESIPTFILKLIKDLF